MEMLTEAPQNGNLKKPIIDLSRNIIHMGYTTFIFLKKTPVNVSGKNSINMNEPEGFNKR